MTKLKQYWTYITHGLAVLIILVNPADIQAIAANHPKASIVMLAVWGYLLAWAKSPKQGAQQ